MSWLALMPAMSSKEAFCWAHFVIGLGWVGRERAQGRWKVHMYRKPVAVAVRFSPDYMNGRERGCSAAVCTIG